KLPTEIVKQRSREVSALVREMTLEKNRKWVGWKGEALALKREREGRWTLLRNKSYKLVAVKDNSLILGNRYSVQIEEGLKTRLLGQIL
ncbi:MAG: hypothetical protein DRP02_05245, partial [Candidatus Gerdarchaeota archaeon]